MKTIIIACLAGSICTAAFAQQEGKSDMPATKSEKFFQTEVQINGDYAFRANVDGGGDVAVTRAMLSASISHAFTPDLRVSLLVSNETSWYDFKNATGLIAGTGKPFGQLSEMDIAPTFSYKVNEQWSALGGTFFRIAGEDDADTGDSFTWGGYGAARYSPSKDFSISFGVRANTRIEEDTRVLPAFAMDWRVSEKVRFTVAPGVGGVSARVTSQLNDQLAFLAEAVYQDREFRLNDETPLPSGVVRDQRATVGVGVVWTPCEKVEVTARVGAVAWQEFQIDDRNGNQQSKANTNATPYLFLGGSISF